MRWTINQHPFSTRNVSCRLELSAWTYWKLKSELQVNFNSTFPRPLNTRALVKNERFLASKRKLRKLQICCTFSERLNECLNKPRQDSLKSIWFESKQQNMTNWTCTRTLLTFYLPFIFITTIRLINSLKTCPMSRLTKTTADNSFIHGMRWSSNKCGGWVGWDKDEFLFGHEQNTHNFIEQPIGAISYRELSKKLFLYSLFYSLITALKDS